MSGSPVTQEAPPRLDALTGIRGIAAWLVVIYHIRLSLLDIVPPQVIAAFAKGYLAVDLFFVLSGFVLWFNYGERIRDGGRAQVAPFLWRRFARVWPLHAFILAAFVGLALLLSIAGKPSADYPFAELPLHILLVQNWGFTSELSWNDPSWSISTEFAAYCLFPVIALAANWRALSTFSLAGITALLLTAIAALFAAAGETTLGADIARFGLWRCLLEFSLGICACLWWERLRDGAGAAGLLAGVAAAILLAVGLVLRLPEIVWVPALFFATILALALGRGAVVRLLSTRAAVYMGEISYSTYLAHFLLFILFKLAFVGESLQIGWGGLLGFMTLLLVASVALYHLVELPAQRWFNARKPRWATAPRMVPAE